MDIANAVFYGEPVESATAALQLEGKGARLQNIQILKGGGRGTGNAYIGWDGTYSFNFDARGIAAESITLSKTIGQPISALLNFTAAGSGSFDAPRYEVKGELNDVFVADEGIGKIVGGINVNTGLMTVQLEAASPRLSVSVTGQISMPEQDADVSVTVARYLTRPVRPSVPAPALPVHDGRRQRIGARGRQSRGHRQPARGRDGR